MPVRTSSSEKHRPGAVSWARAGLANRRRPSAVGFQPAAAPTPAQACGPAPAGPTGEAHRLPARASPRGRCCRRLSPDDAEVFRQRINEEFLVRERLAVRFGLLIETGVH